MDMLGKFVDINDFEAAQKKRLGKETCTQPSCVLPFSINFFSLCFLFCAAFISHTIKNAACLSAQFSALVNKKQAAYCDVMSIDLIIRK